MMRKGTSIYHFTSGPPMRHDPCLRQSTFRDYAPDSVMFTENSVSGDTLSDLLDKLPAGTLMLKLGDGVWQVTDNDFSTMGEYLPAVLRDFLRG